MIQKYNSFRKIIKEISDLRDLAIKRKTKFFLTKILEVGKMVSLAPGSSSVVRGSDWLQWLVLLELLHLSDHPLKILGHVVGPGRQKKRVNLT